VQMHFRNGKGIMLTVAFKLKNDDFRISHTYRRLEINIYHMCVLLKKHY
jgi:hypothetical protein